MKLALVQLKSETDFQKNLKHATEMIESISGVDMIILPESFIFPFGTEFENITDELIKYFSQLAKDKKTIIVAGSIPEVTTEGTFNTSYVFDQFGEVIAKHRKVYLYDVDLPDLHTKETDRFSKGDSETVFDTPYGKFGLLICYDLRFPNLFTGCAKNGAHTIILPASFSNITGEKHWETLIKARALDSQCFIVGCGAAQNTANPFIAYGHSMISNPDGQILDSLNENEGVLIVDYNPEDVKDIRERLPVLKQL